MKDSAAKVARAVADGAKSAGIIIAALTIRFERDAAGETERVTVLGLPVFDRNWRGVKRRRARREARQARRAARERDAR